MGNKFNSIVDVIGHTPVVRIQKLAPENVNLYVKLEAMNPMGSIKDRLALGVIEDAERRGLLKPGQTVVEATSGNTGIGLAMVCAQRGYPLVVVMAENFSVERRKLMRFLGARVVLTPAAGKGTGMIAKAVELAQEHGWFLCRQFENEANADVHSKTTAQEILEDFQGETLDYWVTGFGTGGTLKGVGRVLREKSPDTKIVVCEPDNSQLLASGLPQERHPDGRASVSHPKFSVHMVQGWAPDFIPLLTEQASELKLVDQFAPVAGGDALKYSHLLATQEGIFTGISGGATFAGALQVAQEAKPGSNILCMLPDTGERYLSTQLFTGVATDMTDEELEISKSTANYQFGKPLPKAPEPESSEPVTLNSEAVKLVEEAIASKDEPVLMFSLEWCEFCWSARNLFQELGIEYRSVDVDSVQYQEGNFGRKIRDALEDKTCIKTIPVIFVDGELIGGCTELFDAYNEGRLQKLLQRANVNFDSSVELDPYSLLPSWLNK